MNDSDSPSWEDEQAYAAQRMAEEKFVSASDLQADAQEKRAEEQAIAHYERFADQTPSSANDSVRGVYRAFEHNTVPSGTTRGNTPQTSLRGQEQSMYVNDTVEMTTTELSGEMNPAEGIKGRIISYSEKDAAALSSVALQSRSKQFADAAKHTSEVPTWMGGLIGEAKKQIPDLNRAQAKTILNAYATDLDHAAKVVEARKGGSPEAYVDVKRENGTSERGIVSYVDEKPVRQGMWIGMDNNGNTRQIASFASGKPEGAVLNYRENGSLESSMYFKQGQPFGQSRKYNEDGEVIHRTEFKDGQVSKSEAVDPVAEKAKKDAQQAEFKALETMKIGR